MSILNSEWFRRSLGEAIATDYFNSLTDLERSQVDHHIARNGQPPGWFLRGLKERGLTFKEPCPSPSSLAQSGTAQSQVAPEPAATTVRALPLPPSLMNLVATGSCVTSTPTKRTESPVPPQPDDAPSYEEAKADCEAQLKEDRESHDRQRMADVNEALGRRDDD